MAIAREQLISEIDDNLDLGNKIKEIKYMVVDIILKKYENKV